jgi:hypothetical protein
MKMSNIIPIGEDCSVALLLKELEIRKASYPFDWITCSFSSAINLINNNFEDFINPMYLVRDKRETHQHVFHNILYNIGFFHDFNQMDELEEQCTAVKQKYDRRIERFYENLRNGCTLLRLSTNSNMMYVYDENKYDIDSMLISYNINNKLIICNTLDEIREYLKEQ